MVEKWACRTVFPPAERSYSPRIARTGTSLVGAGYLFLRPAARYLEGKSCRSHRIAAHRIASHSARSTHTYTHAHAQQ